MTSPLYSTLLLIHITGGSIGLLSAAGALIVAKGKTAHRRWGMAYVLGMTLVSLTAWSMSLLKPNFFLFLIGCFTAFLIASGYVRAKNRSGSPTRMEYGIALGGVATGLLMLAFGFLTEHQLQVVFIVFGLLTSTLAIKDLLALRQSRYKGALRIANHLTHMLAGTIATVTAVAVVNIRGVEPAWLVWLAPALLITPFIIYWNIKTLRPHS